MMIFTSNDIVSFISIQMDLILVLLIGRWLLPDQLELSALCGHVGFTATSTIFDALGAEIHFALCKAAKLFYFQAFEDWYFMIFLKISVLSCFFIKSKTNIWLQLASCEACLKSWKKDSIEREKVKKPPASGHRPPATGHRPPATGHRPPATGQPATGHRPPATGHRATGHRPPATGLRPPATGLRPPATGHRPPAKPTAKPKKVYRRRGTALKKNKCRISHLNICAGKSCMISMQVTSLQLSSIVHGTRHMNIVWTRPCWKLRFPNHHDNGHLFSNVWWLWITFLLCNMSAYPSVAVKALFYQQEIVFNYIQFSNHFKHSRRNPNPRRFQGGACLRGDAGRMASLVKCAGCGKKPGVKTSGQRNSWSLGGVRLATSKETDCTNSSTVFRFLAAKFANDVWRMDFWD